MLTTLVIITITVSVVSVVIDTGTDTDSDTAPDLRLEQSVVDMKLVSSFHLDIEDFNDTCHLILTL